VASKIAEKILDAATECFAAEGFHGCTTKVICAKAGVTEGSLFRLFGSKEKLFEAALRRASEADRMSNAELARILENDKSFERGIRKAMLEFFDRLGEHYVRITTFALLERPELVRAQQPDMSIAPIVAHTILREKYLGNARDDIDPHTAALALVTSLWHLSLVSLIMPAELQMKSKEARRAAVKNFVEIWYRGMQKAPSQKPRKAA
jgi:AcrR family transcriptional regulator